jgi:glycine cleavage system protein P-like pyridoxal-binding family
VLTFFSTVALGKADIHKIEQYALLETHYVVARMAQTYTQLESRDDEEWMELYALALCSKNGARVAARI